MDEPGKRQLRRADRAAGRRHPLEDEHAQPGPREENRGGKPIGPGPDDDGIMIRRHALGAVHAKKSFHFNHRLTQIFADSIKPKSGVLQKSVLNLR